MTTAPERRRDRNELINKVPAPGEGKQETRDERPRVTFMGNSYDLTALGAFATGIILLLMCLTCNQAAYCLPCVPLVLGVIGLIMAKNAVDPERTRLWSWLGIGSTGIIALLSILAVVGYAFFIGFIIFLSEMNY